MQDQYLPSGTGDDSLDTPVDLNAAQPVQHFAFGGIANPGQRPMLRGSDRTFLEARQKEFDEFEKQRLAYNDALTKWQNEVYNPYKTQVDAYNTAAQKYNTEVYDPYKTQVDAYNAALTKYNEEVYNPYATQYAAYEKAVNDWNAGSRESDYAGPAAPTLARNFEMTMPTQPQAFGMTAPTAPKDFDMKAPVLPFKEEEIIKYQQEAAGRAQKDAGQRALALEVVSNPDQFNFGSLSVANRFMAKGGPVEKSAREMLAEVEEPQENAALMRMLSEVESGSKMDREAILAAVEKVAAAGRGGDELLAYLSPESMTALKRMGGAGTINPATGLPEFKGGVIGRISRGIRGIFGRSSRPQAAVQQDGGAAAPVQAAPAAPQQVEQAKAPPTAAELLKSVDTATATRETEEQRLARERAALAAQQGAVSANQQVAGNTARPNVQLPMSEAANRTTAPVQMGGSAPVSNLPAGVYPDNFVGPLPPGAKRQSEVARDPQVAAALSLMYRSHTGGAPTAEFDRMGGYDAVSRLAASAGHSATPQWIAGYEQSMGMPESEYTKRNKQFLTTAGGMLSSLPKSTINLGGPAASTPVAPMPISGGRINVSQPTAPTPGAGIIQRQTSAGFNPISQDFLRNLGRYDPVTQRQTQEERDAMAPPDNSGNWRKAGPDEVGHFGIGLPGEMRSGYIRTAPGSNAGIGPTAPTPGAGLIQRPTTPGFMPMDPEFLRNIGRYDPVTQRQMIEERERDMGLRPRPPVDPNLPDVSDTFRDVGRVYLDNPTPDYTQRGVGSVGNIGGITIRGPATPGAMPDFGSPRTPGQQASSPSNFFGLNQPAAPGMNPGTVSTPYNPLAMYQGPSPVQAIANNPNLSPGMLGGQQNAGMMTDRLGNRIYAPGTPPFGFAKGGEADINAMRALVDASNMADEEEQEEVINTDPVGSAKSMLSELMAQEKPRAKATGKVGRMPATGGGAASPKEMELAAGPLATGQDFAIKEPKSKGKGGKSAKEQLQALARQYKLKLRATENESRGLMRSTLGAPTLEQPTLTSETLGVRRFQKGGEAKKSEGQELRSPEEQPVTEESSASRALKSMVSPVMEGLRGYAGLEPSASGSDAYRTGQALGNMPGVGVPGALAGIFIGKGAKGWNAASNALAQKMTKQGAAPEEVWKATGNFKAPDGMWRQEISDAGATIRESVLQGPAERVLSHPELFANYPELGKIMTSKDPYSTRSVLMGGSGPGASIRLGTAGGKNENAKGMLHELQHGIQFREGFGQGGSKNMAFNDPQAFEILKEVRGRMAQPTSIEKFAKVAWQSDEVTPEIAKKYQEYLDYHKKSLKTMDRAAQEGAADLYYKRLLGEAEARAVEDRKMWTPDQRLRVIPSQSYRMNAGRDIIPLDKLIVKRAEGSPKEGEVSDAEMEAASRPAFVAQRSGIGRRRGPISDALNTGSAYVAAAKGTSELPYDLVGAPVDIATMALRPLGYNVDKPVMGSDWIKEKMTRAGVRQAPPEDPTAKGFYTAGELMANVVNPAAAVRSGIRGAQRVGQAARNAAQDFQQYNRQLAAPGASYAVRPEGTQLMIRRDNNPDWVGDLVDSGVKEVRQVLPGPQLGTERQSMMENFWENKATNYFSKQFGTESDPVYRGIREQTIKSPSLATGFPNYILDQLPVGKTRVNQETGQTRFFPKYPEAWDEMRKRYDAYTNIRGAVPELNPQRVMDPDYTYSVSREGSAILEGLRDKEIDRMIAQGTPASQANPNLDFLTRSVRAPDTVVGPYNAKSLLTDFETTTGTRVGDPNFQGVPSALPMLPQNLRTAIEKGEIIYNTPGPDASIRNLFDVQAINEYLAGLPERELKNIRFEDAVKGGAKVSAERFARDTLVADIKAGRRVPDKFFSEGVSAPLMQFKEGPYEGYAWKRIEKAEATVPEGAYVGHSVGGYAKGGAYGPEKHKLFNDGTMQVYTLRDNRNRPVNTIEVRVDPMASGPIVTQIKGNGRATGNTAPVAYDNLVLDFLQNTLKPMRITESDTYLTPLLKSYRDQLNAARP